MFPDSPFAEPVGSFQFPVDPITANPGDAPLETICINSEWLAYLRGAAKQLLLQSTWRTEDPNVLATCQGQAFDLIDLLQDSSCAISYPNWKYGLGSNDGDPLGELIDLIYTQGINSEHRFIIYTGIIANFWHFRFQAKSDNALVGGPVLAMELMSVGACTALCDVLFYTCNQANSVTFTDSGIIHVQSHFTDIPQEISDILIACSEPVYFKLTIVDDFTCGQA